MLMSKARTILVTGGNGGLGQAIGRGFLENEAECRLWLGVRSNRAAAEELVAEFPERCRLVELEVCDPEGWQSAIGEILEADGSIDVLVNNAGLHRDHLLATMPAEAWSEVIRTNLDAVFHGCRAVVKPMMRQRSGRIVNISSLSALLSPIGQTNYAASKAGLLGFTKSLARELASRNITVNAVAPGLVPDTGMTADLDEEMVTRMLSQVPAGRPGTPEEVAHAVA